MEFDLSQTPASTVNKLLLGTVIPRPIAWVSSVDPDGRPNLAPFSFFNAVCSRPPTLLFCPGIRGTDAGVKDTLNNVRATGQFVVNVVTEELLKAMNVTATELPSQVNEFELAGVTPVPSKTVRPPRVAESPIHFECEVTQIVDIGDGGKGSGSVVIGRVLHLHVSDEILLPDDKIDFRALRPVGRLSGPNYSTLGKILEISRLPSQVGPRQQ